VLFERWFNKLLGAVREEKRLLEDPESRQISDEDIYLQMWDAEDPLETPTGLARTDLAVQSFIEAVEEVEERWGDWDVSWGEVHRVRIGDVDVPVGGGASNMGCFRVLSFRRERDGRLAARSGDGWVLAVEFGEIPRAYSVLAYGQTIREDSPHHSDQAAMFAENRMKPVAFTEDQIAAQLLYSYHPGKRKRRR
jgi:acyl-homoserine-lactone acylase